MSENSAIEWTDHTFNPWVGCTQVSPGCLHCYAETLDKRHLREAVDHWGKGAPRLLASEKTWGDPVRWNRVADKCRRIDGDSVWVAMSESLGKVVAKCLVGNSNCMAEGDEREFGRQQWDGLGSEAYRPKVFCASLADWLDDEVPIEWLARLLALIHVTPNLDWLLLTKRPQNWKRRMMDAVEVMTEPAPLLWMKGWLLQADMPPCTPANVWIGTTVEDQARADERIPQLLAIPAKVRFLSCEPLLGPVLIDNGESSWLSCKGCSADAPCYSKSIGLDHFHGVDWVICGGESGAGARPMHPDWARSLRDQCAAAGVPFFFKQWGEWIAWQENEVQDWRWKSQAGKLIDPHAFPDFNDQPKGWEVDHATATAWEKVGKKAAGRLLDGREHNDFPR